MSFPCTTGIPRREQVSRRGARVWFVDPPHVAGDGWPSGGADQADGLVTIPSGSLGPVNRATCTLPGSQHHACRVALGDVSARYG
jgi:hypothetical protein